MPTMQQLAAEMSESFEVAERANGQKYTKLKDDAPQWMTDVVHAAHRTGPGDWDVMMPYDHRFEFARAAVDALAEHESEEDARDSIEPDIYAHELTAWLHSRADRYGYCDEAASDGLWDVKAGILAGLQSGQVREKEEVFDLVLDALRELADGSEDDESDDDPDDDGPTIECDECGEDFPDSSDIMSVLPDGEVLCPDCFKRLHPEMI